MAVSSLLPIADAGRTAPARPDRVTVWPLDDGRYGVDVTYQGASGYELASRHERALTASGIPFSFRQELDGAWTVRLTTPAGHVARVVAEFVGDQPV